MLKQVQQEDFLWNVGTCSGTTCPIRCPMREHTTSRLLSWINEIQFVLNRGRIFKGILCNPMWRRFKGQKNQVRNIEEYTLSKYGDILGS